MDPKIAVLGDASFAVDSAVNIVDLEGVGKGSCS
jgi:hypothetical protein